LSQVAFLTGISGQDGSYLAELLLKEGFEVHGLIRRNSTPEHQSSRFQEIDGKIITHYGDLLDQSSLNRLVAEVQPELIFNLAAQSHVRISFDMPQFTASANAIGVLNMLEAFREGAPTAKFYQASSSEMFGTSVDEDGFQRETTPMMPVSPYGCAKLFGFHIVRNYRKAYGVFASNGILFNHESPRRGSNFVTSKVVKAAVEISLGLRDKLELGNLESFRDWGHSKDYVRAMMLILRHNQPDDFVIATGQTHSVREMVEGVFSRLDLNYKDHVVTNPRLMRPEELPYLRGDSSKARSTLGWEPLISFDELLDDMVDGWSRALSRK
jgi:GDPmannose 4,6-dehydratase